MQLSNTSISSRTRSKSRNMTTYVEDPFSIGITPGTTEGIKLCMKAIADRATKEDIS